MEIISTIVGQVSIMYVLMAIGFIVYRKNLINEEGAKQISNLLVWVINPLIMLTRYQMNFSMEKLEELGISFLVSLCAMLIGFLIGKIIFKKNQRIDKFAIGFANAGFIGIPLVTNLMGIDKVFFLSAYLVCFNILSYTYGIYMVSNNKNLITVKSVLLNPGIIAVAFGLLIFVSPVKLPSLFYDAFNLVGQTNTPIAMILLGTYIAKAELITLFNDRHAYFVAAIKLVVIPIIITVLFKFLPPYLVEIKKVVLIAMSTPVGLTVPMFSQMYGGDYEYGAKLVGLSTLLSLATIPVILFFANIIW
ncbi:MULTISPECIES: AEC family transporter [unclassified Clostridium]|uniref:AEC family transporter n=1 Tax=unclassified Clostridium TaxID=2614128 RepID=UPI0002975DA0|nr:MULTISPECIES: AEC family transporter [unclassified Clostridium]EKQ51272.1 MAG: putative permease [Clostridium sp. Maddingley MBC34-26]